jgi:flavin reductase (DIM6/NTAB) family NADH-FMN oxidoreductase RutF
MKISNKAIQAFPYAKRLNLVNSLSGVKQACLIGTISEDGKTNVSPFNSIVHLGSSPALMGFIVRPHHKVPRDTFENLKATGSFTINHIHETSLVNAHYTSAKLDTSEFEACNLTPEFLEGCVAPFVGESIVKMEMKFVEALPISHNNTTFVIGELVNVYLPPEIISSKGYLNFEQAKNVLVSGLNRYYKSSHVMDLPFARPDQIPNF